MCPTDTSEGGEKWKKALFQEGIMFLKCGFLCKFADFFPFGGRDINIEQK